MSKQYTSVPNNFRQLKGSEIIRAEDIYRNETTGQVQPTKFSIGRTVSNYHGYTFWRRRHTAASSTPKRVQRWRPTVAPVVPTPTVVKVPQDEPKKPVTIVTFEYNGTKHTVQVIKLDTTYLKGLDITVKDYKYHYQFKTFRLDRVNQSYGIRLTHFGDPLS